MPIFERLGKGKSPADLPVNSDNQRADDRRQRVHGRDPPAVLPAGDLDADRFALAVEIGDWQRLSRATSGSYLGLVPTEHFSGEKRSQGGITKTGNTHARQLLTEIACHHKPRYRPGKTMLDR